MAPRGRRGEADEAQPMYQLGQQGRKTGISLANTGQRDEHGFAPLDSLFSSPQKAPARASHNGNEEEEESESDDGSQAMEIPSSAGPGPNTVLRQQRESRVPMSRSPVKTHLMSPARRNPLVGSSPNKSSPMRPSGVRRTLDFQSPAQKGASRFSRANGINGSRVQEVDDEEEEEHEEPEQQHFDDPGPEDYPPMGPDEDDMVDALLGDDDSLDGDDGGMNMNEPSPPPPPPSSEKRKRAPAPARKGSRQPTVSVSPAASRTRQRPPVSRSIQEEPEELARQQKRQKTTSEPPKPAPKPGRPRGRPPGSKSKPGPKPKAKPAPPGRKPKTTLSAIDEDEEDDVGETSFAALQKGPPMPKRPGLVSMKRDPDVITQTRSGRHSYRPLNYWAGEQVITEDEERQDMFTNDRGFVMGSMKDIVRVEEDEPRSKRPTQGRPRGRPPKGNRRQKQVEEEIDEAEEPEEWETDPAAGHVVGEVIAWEPEYETHPPGDDDLVHISEEQIAISGHGIQTAEVSEAEFRFAKTLTMPFMGAGIVDLPPGTEKRPKNSRKMHLVFFVHYGKVAVWVNEGHFRISAGGQWFVPRGNHYSIINDYNQPARIFFAQACEMAAQPIEEEEEEDVEGESSLMQQS